MTGQPSTGQLGASVYEWDFFLAHAGGDLDLARNLKRRLEPPAKAFLDDENIPLGEDWDTALSSAQQSSLITVVIVTAKTTAAYYVREEIAAAIQMAREDPDSHRVIPLYYLTSRQQTPGAPYGLRLKHSLTIEKSDDLTIAAKRLLETLEWMKPSEIKRRTIVAAQRTAVDQLATPQDAASFVAGVNAVTAFVRPLMLTLLGVFVMVSVLWVLCLVLDSFKEVRGLATGVLAGVWALLLASILWLFAQSLKYAQLFAQGRVNAG
jgi:hypothetical protein